MFWNRLKLIETGFLGFLLPHGLRCLWWPCLWISRRPTKISTCSFHNQNHTNPNPHLYISYTYTISIQSVYNQYTFAIPLRYLCDLWSQNPWNPHCHTIHVLSSDGLCRILWTGCKRPHIWSSFNVSTSWKWLRQVHWVGSVWKCLESEARS